jgi:DNA-binding response OmpR family regulator
MRKTTVLICDDCKDVHQTLMLYLEKAGYEVLSAYDGMEALDIINQQRVDLLVLDMMMPKLPGEDVCRQIRRKSNIPIIILSAKAEESDRIAGFNFGADDYVTKPFSPKEVATRVKTVLRRTQLLEENKILELGNLRIYPKSYEVYIGDSPVKLTPREFELLAFMVEYAGVVVTREQILNAVWGYDYYGDTRTVDTLMAKLRAKIPERLAGVTFRSIYGVGYTVGERHE